MKLFFRKYGDVGIPVIVIHGLYGASDNWINIARDLAENFEVFLIDQRNHGQSPHSDRHDYISMREDLREFMDDQRIQKAILIGHSMGGKTAMFFASAYPDRVQSLISVDIAPVAYHDLALYSHFAANHAAMIDAMMELDLDTLQSREEADQALAAKIGSDRIRNFLLKNLKRNSDGSFEWKLNLKVIRENLHGILDGLDVEKISRSGGITGFPVLFLAGEKSDYIRTEDHRLIKSVFPTAEIVTIPGAGHWVHAEQPELLLKNIRYFLAV